MTAKITTVKVEHSICQVLAARLKQPVAWAGIGTIVAAVMADPTFWHFLSNLFTALEDGKGWLGAFGVAFGSVVLFWQQQHPVTPIAQGGELGDLARNAGMVAIGANVLGSLLKRSRKPKAEPIEPDAP